MQRRAFLRQAAVTAAVASSRALSASGRAPANPHSTPRAGQDGAELSSLGFGGIVVMIEDTARAMPRGGSVPSRAG